MVNYTGVWSVHKNVLFCFFNGFSLFLSMPSLSLNYVQANKAFSWNTLTRLT